MDYVTRKIRGRETFSVPTRKIINFSEWRACSLSELSHSDKLCAPVEIPTIVTGGPPTDTFISFRCIFPSPILHSCFRHLQWQNNHHRRRPQSTPEAASAPKPSLSTASTSLRPSQTQLIPSPSHDSSFLLPSPLPFPALLDTADGARSLSYPSLISQFRNLSKGSIAFVLCPPHLNVPVLYLALLSLGALVSPSNPSSSPQEILHQIALVKPSLAFATSESASKLPPHLPTVLLDSTEFISNLTASLPWPVEPCEDVKQQDPAAILFSSETTGNMKGVVLTHRNLIAAAGNTAGTAGKVGMVTVPVFHVYGFLCCLKGLAKGETVVVMTERFEIGRLMRAVERCRVTNLVVAPPVLLKIVRDWDGVELGCLEVVGRGGAPVGVELIRRFLAKFPNVSLSQVSTRPAYRAVPGPDIAQKIKLD